MTYLELVQRLHREMGASGSTPTAVAGQTGLALLQVGWITSAYEEVQRYSPCWNFLKFDFDFTTTAAQQNYSKTDASLTELSKWHKEGLSVYESSYSDEQQLAFIEWEAFKPAFMFGSLRSQSQKPNTASISPQNELYLWPVPNTTYHVLGEYFKRPQTMTATTDEPLVPEQFQMAIVWKALMYSAAYDGAQEVYAHAYNMYNDIMMKLCVDQMPAYSLGEPLA